MGEGSEGGTVSVRAQTPFLSRGSFGDVIFGDDAMENAKGKIRYGANL